MSHGAPTSRVCHTDGLLCFLHAGAFVITTSFGCGCSAPLAVTPLCDERTTIQDAVRPLRFRAHRVRLSTATGFLRYHSDMLQAENTSVCSTRVSEDEWKLLIADPDVTAGLTKQRDTAVTKKHKIADKQRIPHNNLQHTHFHWSAG